MKDLLPRLHEVDSYSLSGWAEGKLTTAKHQEENRKLKTARDHDTGLFSQVIPKYTNGELWRNYNKIPCGGGEGGDNQ